MCYVRMYIICLYISVCIYINVCWCLFKYACMLVYVYTCICIYVGVHVCVCVYIVECICVRVGVKRVFMLICMFWLRATVFWTRSVRSEPSYRRPGPDPDSCSLWTRCTGDSKTGPWDNP